MATSQTIQLDSWLKPLRLAVDRSLEDYTGDQVGCPQRLAEAIRYSVLAPGKRIRPILTLLACEAVSGDWQAALPVACAVEFVHVYSLIHDDLPCMDDDNLRRGRPTCHIQFDEATAVLTGDCLQMMAIELLVTHLPNDQAVRCCGILSRAAGRSQLVGGQMDDLSAEGRFGISCDLALGELELLKSIHFRKTSALIEAALHMGGVVGGADESTISGLRTYGRCVGLAFQIVDDCLDLEGTTEQLGKTTRKDSRSGKLTYPQLLGLEASKQLAEQLISEACAALSVLGERAGKLNGLAKYVIDRTH
jgi:geranylgeranyl diphosphate synthase, type II